MGHDYLGHNYMGRDYVGTPKHMPGTGRPLAVTFGLDCVGQLPARLTCELLTVNRLLQHICCSGTFGLDCVGQLPARRTYELLTVSVDLSPACHHTAASTGRSRPGRGGRRDSRGARAHRRRSFGAPPAQPVFLFGSNRLGAARSCARVQDGGPTSAVGAADPPFLLDAFGCASSHAAANASARASAAASRLPPAKAAGRFGRSASFAVVLSTTSEPNSATSFGGRASAGSHVSSSDGQPSHLTLYLPECAQ